MANFSGVFAVFAVLLRPSLVVPHVQVDDIRQLDWQSLYDHGVRFLVFDKDNCLTKPHKDGLEEAIRESWQRCQQVFGRENILMVSNSSGSSSDPSGLGAESLSRELGVPVLCHAQKKPSARCAAEALNYFVALTSGEQIREQMLHHASIMPPGFAANSADLNKVTRRALAQMKRSFTSQVPLDAHGQGSVLLVGDRTMTDVVLAHRMNDDLMRRRRKLDLDASSSSRVLAPQCISVLTTQIWAKEGIINSWLRKVEARITAYLIRKGHQPGQAAFYQKSIRGAESVEWQKLATFQHDLNAALPESQLALHADQDGTSEYPLTRNTISTPSPPHSPVGTPTLGALLITGLTRSLPPFIGRLVATLLRSRPISWITGNFQTGWNVMIAGLASGMHHAGLPLHRRTAALVNSEAEDYADMSIRPRPSASASLARMLDSRIPQLDTATSARVGAFAGNVHRRLSASTVSARQFLATHLPKAQAGGKAAAPAQAQMSPKASQLLSQGQTQRRAMYTSSRIANQHREQASSHTPQAGKGPFRPSAKNWLAALAAVVLVPTCYYGGMKLSEYRSQLQADKLIDPEHLPFTPAQPAREQVAQGSTSPCASDPSARALIDRKTELQRSLYHLVHDRKEVTEKLQNLRQRMQSTATQEN